MLMETQAQQLVATVLSQPKPLDGQKTAQVGILVRRAFLQVHNI